MSNWRVYWYDDRCGISAVYIRYQGRARAAASNDTELQADFLRKLGNLIRHKRITESNFWNFDEKGIIMGKNSKRTMAIVRVKGKSIVMIEGTREFSSILETQG